MFRPSIQTGRMCYTPCAGNIIMTIGTIGTIVLRIVGALLFMRAQAAIITFDAHPTDFGNPIVDSGFQFAFTAGGFGVFDPGSSACCNINYNGTPALFADGDPSGQP